VHQLIGAGVGAMRRPVGLDVPVPGVQPQIARAVLPGEQPDLADPLRHEGFGREQESGPEALPLQVRGDHEPSELGGVRVEHDRAVRRQVRTGRSAGEQVEIAAGLEPGALARRLQAKLKEFVVNPIVTVSLEEPVALEVSVVGEVTRPGVYRMDQDPTVLKALASAGGLTPLAGRDRIFVLRHGERSGDALAPVRIRFTYEALAHAEGPAARGPRAEGAPTPERPGSRTG